MPGNTVIVDPTGAVLAGPVREEERVVTAELDLDLVRTGRRFFDPVGHYNRPDVFRLAVDTAPRPAVVEMDLANHPAAAGSQASNTDRRADAAPALGNEKALRRRAFE